MTMRLVVNKDTGTSTLNPPKYKDKKAKRSNGRIKFVPSSDQTVGFHT